MAVAANAEAYAASRVGIFFPAHNQTPADGNLTGQCVTLNKWFLAEMTTVPAPFSARGDARYVGKTLVNQGHAVQVPYEQRRRGDFAVFEYGTWGHIGVLLDQDRIFEQNVNVGGVARRLVDGSYVYASRIGRLSETWRPVRATIYRIKSYNEGGTPPQGDDDMIAPTEAEVYAAFRRYAGKEPANPAQVQHYMARDKRDLYADLLNYEVIPKKAEVEQAFKDFQPWLPINAPPYTDQTNYYSNKPWKILLSDLAIGLKKKLAQAETPPATPVNKDVVVKYIQENLK